MKTAHEHSLTLRLDGEGAKDASTQCPRNPRARHARDAGQARIKSVYESGTGVPPVRNTIGFRTGSTPASPDSCSETAAYFPAAPVAPAAPSSPPAAANSGIFRSSNPISLEPTLGIAIEFDSVPKLSPCFISLNRIVSGIGFA
jgi:hypothetical protein